MKKLQIFTDGSIYEDKLNSRYIGCAGAIATCNGNILTDYYQILDENIDCTNNRTELTGILLALELANRFRNNYNDICIISDSKISIFTLREWIFKWIQNAWYRYRFTEGQVLDIRNTAGPIKNADMITNIIHYILYNNLSIKFYHIKGHVNTSNRDSLDYAKRLYKEYNGIDLTDDQMKSYCYFNNKVDLDSKEYLKQYILTYVVPLEHRYPNPIIHYPTMDDMKKYKKLI